MAYDPIRKEIVLFGGGPEDPPMDDTWVFAKGQWKQRHPATSPFGVDFTAMAYDPNLEQVVIFGGESHGNSTDDMFAWDGANWTQLQPAVRPEARDSAGFAYDPTRNALILFGGINGDTSGPGVPFNDTWSWDGKVWTQIDAKRSPKALLQPAMATLGNRVGLFGGFRQPPPGEGGGRPTQDTWRLRADGWRKIDTVRAPAARFGASAAWDDARKQMVILGGKTAETAFDDTWTLGR